MLNSSFIDKLSIMVVNNGMADIAIWGVAFGLIACLCYFVSYDSTKPLKTIWIAMIGPLSIILCTSSTVNWILLFVPFLSILIANCQKRSYMQLIDFGYNVFYILMLFYQQIYYFKYVHYGEGMFDYSPLSFLRGATDLLITARIVPTKFYSLLLGAISSIYIFYIVSLCPFRLRDGEGTKDNEVLSEKDYNSLFDKFVVSIVIYIAPIMISIIM